MKILWSHIGVFFAGFISYPIFRLIITNYELRLVILGSFLGGLLSYAVGKWFYKLQTKDTINLDDGMEATLEMLNYIYQMLGHVHFGDDFIKNNKDSYGFGLWTKQRRKCYFFSECQSPPLKWPNEAFLDFVFDNPNNKIGLLRIMCKKCNEQNKTNKPHQEIETNV